MWGDNMSKIISIINYKKQRKMQDLTNELILKDLSSWGMQEIFEFLDLIIAVQKYVDDPNIVYDKNKILEKLYADGFKVNDSCEDEYIEGNKFVEFRYIIGQFMCYIKYDLYTTKLLLPIIAGYKEKYGIKGKTGSIINSVITEGTLESLQEAIKKYPEDITDNDIISLYFYLYNKSEGYMYSDSILSWVEEYIVGRATSENIDCMLDLVGNGYEWVDLSINEQKVVVARNIRKKLKYYI